MARERDPNRDKAFEIWKQHNGNITNREIAKHLNVLEKTISAWKSRDKWNVVLQKNDCSTTNKKTSKKARSTIKKKRKEPEEESSELTDKQRDFCLHYVKYWNATKAYKKAFDCSYNTANAEGYKYLVKPCIKAEIERLKEERAKAIMIDNQIIIQKYIDIAFADLTDFVEFGQRETEVINENGDTSTQTVNYVNIKNSDEVDGTIITEVKQGRDGVSIKLADRLKALEEIKKYFSVTEDEESVNGLDQLADAIRKSATAIKGDS